MGNLQKVGRNEPCPCGSGRKFKQCHGTIQGSAVSGPHPELEQRFREFEAHERQRQKQQGHGRPIISEVMKGYRFVAVGSHLFFSNNWKTFYDFLFDYIKRVMGSEWGNSELKKPATDRHPLLNWYEATANYIRSHVKERGEVHLIESIGIVSAYAALAYNLYLIAHNQKLEELLLKRLRDRNQFLPAYYEVLVFGALIRAGFELEFEDESDALTTHCELTAIFKQTGKRFSVEAKMRQAETKSTDIGRQIKKALRKRALHTRIIFVEANIPEVADDTLRVKSLNRILGDIRRREEEEISPGMAPPPAYIVVTNHPYLYFPDRPSTPWALTEGFRIDDFGWGRTFSSIRELVEARDRHFEMFALQKSWEENYRIPSTFDGELAELVFGDNPPPLTIGKRYEVPDGNARNVVAELKEAVIMEQEKAAYGVFRTEDGKNLMARCPLTDDELAAYREHPETFFGVLKSNPKPITDPLELYDWFFAQYRNTPKEKLVEFMGESASAAMRELPQSELARLYCESLVNSIMPPTVLPETAA